MAIIALGTITLGQTLECATTLLGFYDTGNLAALRRALTTARGTSLIQALLVVGILAGCAEELLFRGLIQTRLVARWGRVLGIVVTSVLFGLMHMDALHTPLALAIGLWLGHATERAGSIRPAMVAHAINNMAATAMAAAGLSTPAIVPNVVVGILSLATFLLCVWRLNADLPGPVSPSSSFTPTPMQG